VVWRVGTVDLGLGLLGFMFFLDVATTETSIEESIKVDDSL
jgi:hypothetical protein